MARLNILKLVAPKPAAAPVAAEEPAPMVAPAPAPEPLCLRCAFGVVNRGAAAGEEFYLCVFAGVLRPLPFPVVECSEFTPRSRRGADEGVGFACKSSG